MRVALAEGLAAMTVRRIAAEAGVATGQVHHHFASGGELKSLAFVRLIRELLDADVRLKTPAGGNACTACSAAMTADLNLISPVAGSANSRQPGSGNQKRLCPDDGNVAPGDGGHYPGGAKQKNLP
jgi:AcrR family transcriptional regulator